MGSLNIYGIKTYKNGVSSYGLPFCAISDDDAMRMCLDAIKPHMSVINLSEYYLCRFGEYFYEKADENPIVLEYVREIDNFQAIFDFHNDLTEGNPLDYKDDLIEGDDVNE